MQRITMEKNALEMHKIWMLLVFQVLLLLLIFSSLNNKFVHELYTKDKTQQHICFKFYLNLTVRSLSGCQSRCISSNFVVGKQSQKKLIQLIVA